MEIGVTIKIMTHTISSTKESVDDDDEFGVNTTYMATLLNILRSVEINYQDSRRNVLYHCLHYRALLCPRDFGGNHGLLCRPKIVVQVYAIKVI